MSTKPPCVAIGDLVISYNNFTLNGVGLVIDIQKLENVYRRSHYIYIILWNDYPEPIEHNEESVCRWRQNLLNIKKRIHEQSF